jgi:hypothetical protein
MDRKNEAHFSREDVCSSWLDCQNEFPARPLQPTRNPQSHQYQAAASISAPDNLISIGEDLVGDDLGLFAGKKFFVVEHVSDRFLIDKKHGIR